MTAAVFLENHRISQQVVVDAPTSRASTTYLRSGYKVTTGDLLHLLLIASDNAAARVLARVSTHGSEGFIDRMNVKADELGLDHTYYADPSGLLAANVSSAYDMARLISVCVEGRAHLERHAEGGSTRRRSAALGHCSQDQSAGPHGDVDVLGGKTGFITKAGYCLATLLRLPQGGPQVAVVVLGAKSNAGRFWETRHLFNWLSSKTQDILRQGRSATAGASD